jgi:hypothetical protein
LSSGKIRRIEKDKKDFAMVDETGTTPRLGRGVHGQVISDIIAAINIARIKGKSVGKPWNSITVFNSTSLFLILLRSLLR